MLDCGKLEGKMPVVRLQGVSKLYYVVAQLFCFMAYPLGGDRGGFLLHELVNRGVDGLAPRERRKVSELELLLLRRLEMRGRERIVEEAAVQFAKGSVAGRVLLYALRSGVHRPEHRSLKKAIFLSSELSKKWVRPPTRLPMSQSKIMTYWTEFRSVAHLHAADILMEHEKRNWLSGESTAVSKFLSIAEQISARAHEQVPPLGRKSKSAARDGRRLLDRKIAVRIIGGPRRLQGRIEFEDLSQEELSVLAKYRG